MVDEYFSFLSARMSAEAELLHDFYRKHPGKLGEAREVILQSFFSTYLPKSLSVGSGFSLLSSDRISTEQDIIVYDALHSPVLFPRKRSAIYPHSALRALVEVKSNLGKSEIVDSVAKAGEVKKQWRTAPIVPLREPYNPMEPLVCLFGFSGPNLATVKENVIETQREVPLEDRLDLVCLLRAGVISSGTYFRTARFGQPQSRFAIALSDEARDAIHAQYPEGTLCYEVNENALLIFYHWMTSYVMRMQPVFPDLINYAPSGMEWGKEI